MLYALPSWLKGPLAILLILCSTLFWFPVLLAFAILKLILPVQSIRVLCTQALNGIANIWIGSNGTFINLLHRIQWHIIGLEGLKKREWYFVTCNHQTWADIPVIQYVLHRRIPLLKFFLKRQLIWVPLLGIAWWALDFPFMQRYSKELLERRPELKGKDLETTKRACEKFKYTPVTVFNFLEGTRLTSEKYAQQKPPYRNLLRPKAGGAAFVMGAMGDHLHTMLDVTILYPDGRPSFWKFLSGQMHRIAVHIKTIQIPSEFLNRDYMNDAQFRDQFQSWVTDLWHEKDWRLERMKTEYGVTRELGEVA
ncbi:acyltransferase [Marinobacteraceae bacterium S3BR75-40.1]